MAGEPSRCPGCGLEMPPGGTLYPGYYHVSAECWSVYMEVLAREFGNAVLFGQAHQLTVDAYAVQHAGGAHKPKSVCVHLVGLELQLEHGIASPDVPRRLQRLAASRPDWPRLDPPEVRWRHTVLEVALVDSPLEHAARVRAWAAEVWDAWGECRAVTAPWVALCLGAEPAARGGAAQRPRS